MLFLEWDEKFSVGIKQFDLQHRELVNIINELHAAMKAGKAQAVMGEIFSKLIKYTASHFQSEETLLRAHGYPGLSDHKEEHEELVSKVLKLKQDFDAGKLFMGMETLDFLRQWLVIHIQGSDEGYKDFLNKKGIH